MSDNSPVRSPGSCTRTDCGAKAPPPGFTEPAMHWHDEKGRTIEMECWMELDLETSLALSDPEALRKWVRDHTEK